MSASVTRIDRSSATLHVFMRPTKSAGVRFTDLRVVTHLTEVPEISIPARAVVTGKFSVIPKAINFGVVNINSQRKVLIRKTTSSPLPDLKVR